MLAEFYIPFLLKDTDQNPEFILISRVGNSLDLGHRAERVLILNIVPDFPNHRGQSP